MRDEIEKSLGRFEKVVGFFARLYLLFVCLWTVCYLVGEILEMMGVG